MANRTIQVDYDLLRDIGQRFEQQAETCETVQRVLQQRADGLTNGGWTGEGAQAFGQEMETEVFPALARMVATFQRSAEVTGQIAQIFREAEYEAKSKSQLDTGIGPHLPADGSSLERPDATVSGASSSLLKTILSVYNGASAAETLLGFASGFVTQGFAPRWAPPKALELLKNNPYLEMAGKGFAAVGVGVSLAEFADDPSIESGAGLGASGLGLYGAFSANPALGPLASAFAGGYAIGDTFIAPHTTEPLSNALTKWDPLELGYSPVNYPRGTIKDYERSGQTMPIDVASDVFRGLHRYSKKEAVEFAKQYSQKTGTSTEELHFKAWGPCSFYEPWLYKD